MEVKLTKDTYSCSNCDAINYKPSFSYNTRIVEKLYKVKIGYTVMCLCENCLKEMYLLANEILNNKGENQ